MAITRYAGDRYTGLSTDTKPTDILSGAEFLETDTGDAYFYNGSSWQLINGSGLQASDNATITGDWTFNTEIDANAGISTSVITMGALSITEAAIGDWNTAYGWGDHAAAGYVPDSRTITAGTGLSGGGNLSADRTLDLDISTLSLATAAMDINDQIVVWDSIDNAHRRMELADLSAGVAITESQISDLGNYIENVVEDTSPQLGGDLETGFFNLVCQSTVAEHAGDTGTYIYFTPGLVGLAASSVPVLTVTSSAVNSARDIDLGSNHLICDQRIAEHSGDVDTYIDFPGFDQFRVVVAGASVYEFSTSGLDFNNKWGLYDLRIAEHNGDSDTYMSFPGSNQWSVTVGGTDMLEVGGSGVDINGNVDIDGHCKYRADVTAVGTGSGTTTIGSAQTGNVYYATPTFFNSRSFRLDSATVGTQIEVHMNGAGTVQFTQGTGQTIIQGNNWKMVDGSAAKAICVATNTWSVVGEQA